VDGAGVGFLTLIGLARAGSILFWHVRHDLPGSAAAGASPKLIGATLRCWPRPWR
jgi:multicomponent K+:H+ antiporter subunit D